ncbi:MAG: type III pantothenate kinase, partial [Sedimentisphaerales bacterium]|nr:type III pantothenate kinase [Sedimentisphaerales bacterium]
MNIIAVDIGNTNIGVGLFLDGEEKFIESIPGKSRARLAEFLKSVWERIPAAASSKEGKRDGVVVVSSVKPAWAKMVREIAEKSLGEHILVIGEDIPLPMTCWVDEPE